MTLFRIATNYILLSLIFRHLLHNYGCNLITMIAGKGAHILLKYTLFISCYSKFNGSKITVDEICRKNKAL
jgi:hypothetical protein